MHRYLAYLSWCCLWRSHPKLWSLTLVVIVHLPSTAAAWLTITNGSLAPAPHFCQPEFPFESDSPITVR